jgi:hypothetical protein
MLQFQVSQESVLFRQTFSYLRKIGVFSNKVPFLRKSFVAKIFYLIQIFLFSKYLSENVNVYVFCYGSISNRTSVISYFKI